MYVVISFFVVDAEPGLSGDRFHFNSNGDGPARYNIIHFKQVTPGNYKWIKVGEYDEGELRLNMQGKWYFDCKFQPEKHVLCILINFKLSF